MRQLDIVLLYGKDQSVIFRHIKSIFQDKEIDEKSNMQKMHIANSDKPVVFYSLDIVLAIGYRANSSKAIAFRKWATNTLKEHISIVSLTTMFVVKDFDRMIEFILLSRMGEGRVDVGEYLEL